VWCDKVDIIRGKLATTYQSLEPFITEELEHYFSDPDIRLKDSEYDKRQTQIILSLISDLESGRIDEIASKIRDIRNSGSLWTSGLLRAPFVVCFCFAILQVIAFMYGYGSWMKYASIPATICLVLVALGAACSYGNRIKYLIDFKDVLIIILLCLLVSVVSYEIGWYTRLFYRLSLLSSANQIVEVLDKYKKDHGSYPVNSQYISSLSLPKNIHVYQGEFSKGEVEWDVFELGDSDITVLVEPTQYGIYVPVEKTSLMSFSNFAVYRYFSGDPKWVLGKLHWSIANAYWTEK